MNHSFVHRSRLLLRRPRTTALVCLIGLLFGIGVQARTIYVSLEGSDSGDGSSSRPYQTSQRALRAAANGDRILFGPAHYPGAFTSTKRVTLGAWRGSVTMGVAVPRVDAGAAQSRPIWAGNVGIPIAPLPPPSAVSSPEALLSGSPIELPTLSCGSVQLQGRVADPGGSARISWSVVDGPGEIRFRNPKDPKTLADFNGVGRYVLRLTALEGPYSVSSDMILDTYTNMDCAPKAGIHVDAGKDQSVTNTYVAYLHGEVTAHGLPAGARITHDWTPVSGPSQAQFYPKDATDTRVEVTSFGTYRFQLGSRAGTVHDEDEVTVVFVKKPGIDPPNPTPIEVSVAAPSEVILPGSAVCTATIRYKGSTLLPAGAVLRWKTASGSLPAAFRPDNMARTTASFDVPGTYRLQLWVTIGADQGVGEASVIVRAQPTPISVSVDIPEYVDFPGPASVNGQVRQSGRLVPETELSSLGWSKRSGPGSVGFNPANRANSAATFSVPGTYELALNATLGNLEASAWKTIEVRSAAYYLYVFEDSQRSCGVGNPMFVRNTHATRSIRYRIELRRASLFAGEFSVFLTGTLAPGEAREFACSDRTVGPGLGFVWYKIVGADFVTAASTAALASTQTAETAVRDAGTGSADSGGFEIRSAGAGELLVSWPTTWVGAVLESTGDPGNPGIWAVVPESIATEDGRNVVRLKAGGKYGLFRLRTP